VSMNTAASAGRPTSSRARASATSATTTTPRCRPSARRRSS
jgi:hypothetical protein